MPVTIHRLSDNAEHVLSADVTEKTSVRHVKKEIKENFLPKFPNGCRLKFNGKVMKSRHSLKHYGAGGNDVIIMDDTKDWSSSSSSSNSED